MTTLDPNQFATYFTAVHGRPPFPWQERLLQQVVQVGWPKVISLPSASGKTAVLDVAVFAMACVRRMPRRIALVVDRRIVVDDAFNRARLIREKLQAARDGILKQLATALLAMGGEEALAIAELRGGIYREDRWVRSPAQPVILCSTVDQVGSRLLHRGYGLGSGMWPIHAGLLGNDILIILDEAHCSRPFAETLAAIARFRQVATRPLAAPFVVVTMTATPHGAVEPFRLDQVDRANPVLNRRLTARKFATLHTAEKSKNVGLVEAVATHTEAVVKPGKTILVTVNRVAAARGVAERLLKRNSDRKELFDADIVLLTGRARAVERDALLDRWRERLMAGRDLQAVATKKPLIVVATQCVEVGVDLDVDALVSECCPLDALRQRLGRLDRLGERQESPVRIICRAEQAWNGSNEPEDDTVYGPALGQTWYWLTQMKGNEPELDLGTDALEEKLGALSIAEREVLSAPAPHAPVVFPGYCDLWAQTAPVPADTPELTLFLHGPNRGEPEVRFIWRADLGDYPENWADIVALCPPVVGESVAVRLSEARRWLASEGDDLDAADIEGQPDVVDKHKKGKHASDFRTVLCWRGPERSIIAGQAGEIRPGDTLVAPVIYGGCDGWGWAPESKESVTDCADVARIKARRTMVLRLHQAIIPSGLPASLVALAQNRFDELPDDLDMQIRQALGSLSPPAGSELTPDSPGLQFAGRSPETDSWFALATTLAGERRLRINPHPSGVGLVLSSRRRLAKGAAEFSDEDTASSAARQPVRLLPHLDDVARLARQFGELLHLSPELATDLELAGRCHDLGKADPRFQTWLAGGNRLEALRHGLLAKSTRLPINGAALAAARRLSRYPEGGRHELLSVRLLESSKELLGLASDPDLVMHLVESHHGHCRAFAPVVLDERPVMVTLPLSSGTELQAGSATGLERLGSGVPERFWSLIRRYGWWGLSYLESCLRLADHRASEAADVGGEHDDDDV